jgi:hypothetical protein
MSQISPLFALPTGITGGHASAPVLVARPVDIDSEYSQTDLSNTFGQNISNGIEMSSIAITDRRHVGNAHPSTKAYAQFDDE